MAMITITDQNYTNFINPTVNGEVKLCMSLMRDMQSFPYGSLSFAGKFDLDLIPREEWADRLAAQKAAKATLIDIRNKGMFGQMIPSRDQGNQGYCWAHSTVSAMLLARARDNQPYADLSAYAVACIIKNYRNQGGWGGESLEFVASKGCPTSEFWPQQSKDRKNDNPQTWENAKLHVATEWMELDSEQMEDQVVTCHLLGIPTIHDYNWWSHSVAGCGIESFTGSGRNTRVEEGDILNSWGDGWSDHGIGRLKGRRWLPSQAWALRVATASAA